MSVLLALLIDRQFGEPRTSFHPVVWMGNYLRVAGGRLTACRPFVAFVLGALYWLAGAAVVGAMAYACQMLLRLLPWWLASLIVGVLLKPLLALRVLQEEVRNVEQALSVSVEAGRRQLARIVSRDTQQLDSSEIRESALESLSENLSDSVVAPLFWYALLGLPGAAIYRFANTADAMWGYRGAWEWAGKFAARADDLLNLVPARLTAVILLIVCKARSSAWSRLGREASLTVSPNSGWPMAALALALDVRLRKPGVYALNANGRAPSSEHVGVALRCAGRAAWLFAILTAALTPFQPWFVYG
jgi:adenosylcobinamide-phosphate synthase